ncbi:DUF4815 domain-containing protein [Rhizobium sp. SU303]|uniref:DUF4815 domain-containing protein n=1 Tax=Rhizobium sp. SU303 TaxID=3138065 RepID=UPI001E29F9CC|nr:DUF4815 domain-containing protein [Rhizobium leguminosarum]UFW80025.1 DUF4815 domain-containing protein [Rhizobium leguminosarum bv. viciae]
MYEHESGLPNAFDRAVGKGSWQSVVFYGDRPFLQGPELQELQTIARSRHNRLGRLVAKDGNRIDRADAIVDVEAETVTLSAGSIYVEGDVFPVQAAVLTDVSMTGRTEVGVRVTKSYITHEDDPSLLGIVPGSLAEGEPGAARETVSIAWAWVDDDGDGQFYAVYTLQNGTILDQTGPSILEPAMQALAAYDRPNGNYIVSGCRVTALGADSGDQLFSVEQGEANINGWKRTRYAALRHAEPEAWEELAIPGETHTYTGGAAVTFNVDAAPIGVINSILLTKEKTVTVTRGAIVSGADGLPDTSVISVSLVVQGGTTYVAPADYTLVGNTIDWAPAGAEPAVGSAYQVTYRYRALVAADSFTDTSVTVSGGATGGDIIIAYTQKLPRIDRLCLQQDGSPLYVKGLPARSNPLAPGVPADVLPLCRITNNWMTAPVVENDGIRSLPYSEMWRYFNRILDLDRLVQLERLKSGIDSREPVAKRGMFVDPFIDDSYRDAGLAQTGAIGNGLLELSITPTFYRADLEAPVMLDWTEEVIISQVLKTQCEKINPYANFTPLPGALKLTPAADFWTESRTQWLSPQTNEFNRGTRRNNGPLQEVTTDNQLVDQRVEQAEFLRQIVVAFEISGFGAGEILATLTFDQIDVKPAGTQTADANGKIAGTITIPANVTAGTKEMRAVGQGGTEAIGLFTGQGTIEVDVMRRVTTVNNWTRQQLTVRAGSGNGGSSDLGGGGGWGGADPQAQLFALSETRQVVGVDFHLCNIGDTTKHLLVDQVSTDTGYPTTDISAEAVVSMVGAVVGWKSARYNLPLTTPSDRSHAFVIKTDDNEHSISIAKLGGFDADLQKWVTVHPYVTGPRFSSVNAATWTAHQDEALTFRIMAAKFAVLTKTVELGSFDLVDCSDLQVRAAVELPSAGCSVVFEIERTNGTIYRLLPFQVLPLPEFITETVELRAVLTGTAKLSPILYAPVELVAGEIAESLTYVTRAFDLGAAVRITSYLKTFLPGGAAISMTYSIDGAAFVALPLVDTDPLAYPLWTEKKFEATAVTGTLARLKIEATGGPDARLMIGDFGAGIF